MQANMTMADNKNNRKSKRNFSLEKPIERRFDIEKDVDDAHVESISGQAQKCSTGK